MPVADPSTPGRVLPDPDWDRWEAELREPPTGDGTPGPPEPPSPPHRKRYGGGGDGDESDEGSPGRRSIWRSRFVRLMLGAVAISAVVGIIGATQPASQEPRQILQFNPQGSTPAPVDPGEAVAPRETPAQATAAPQG